MSESYSTPTVIPAEPGWWAIHADASDPERPWCASRVAAWLVDAGRRRHDREAFAFLSPICGGMEGYMMDTDHCIALLHESELPEDVRARLPWVTGAALDGHARECIERESRGKGAA